MGGDSLEEVPIAEDQEYPGQIEYESPAEARASRAQMEQRMRELERHIQYLDGKMRDLERDARSYPNAYPSTQQPGPSYYNPQYDQNLGRVAAGLNQHTKSVLPHTKLSGAMLNALGKNPPTTSVDTQNASGP